MVVPSFEVGQGVFIVCYIQSYAHSAPFLQVTRLITTPTAVLFNCSVAYGMDICKQMSNFGDILIIQSNPSASPRLCLTVCSLTIET